MNPSNPSCPCCGNELDYLGSKSDQPAVFGNDTMDYYRCLAGCGVFEHCVQFVMPRGCSVENLPEEIRLALQALSVPTDPTSPTTPAAI